MKVSHCNHCNCMMVTASLEWNSFSDYSYSGINEIGVSCTWYDQQVSNYLPENADICGAPSTSFLAAICQRPPPRTARQEKSLRVSYTNNCSVLHSTSLISCPVDSGPKSLPTRWRNSWIAPTGFGYLPHLHPPSHQTASLSLFTDKPWVWLTGLKALARYRMFRYSFTVSTYLPSCRVI